MIRHYDNIYVTFRHTMIPVRSESEETLKRNKITHLSLPDSCSEYLKMLLSWNNIIQVICRGESVLSLVITLHF